VKIEYEIVPQLNNKNANDVMNSLDEATQSDEARHGGKSHAIKLPEYS
jgi:hypothetical protein